MKNPNKAATQEVAKKQNDVLMKKTKSQLCEIIHRKDENETKLTEEVRKLNNAVKSRNVDIDKLTRDFNINLDLNQALQHSLSETKKELTEKNVNYVNAKVKYNKCKTNYIIALVFAIIEVIVFSIYLFIK